MKHTNLHNTLAIWPLLLLTHCTTIPKTHHNHTAPKHLAPHMQALSQTHGLHTTPDFQPWTPTPIHPSLSTKSPQTKSKTQQSTLPHTATATGVWILFKTYKNTFSRIDGNNCGFVPSCSHFGLLAIQQHGLIGLGFTFARLLRNHTPQDFYQPHPDGFLKDPVSNYTFFQTHYAPDTFYKFSDPAHAWYLHIHTQNNVPNKDAKK